MSIMSKVLLLCRASTDESQLGLREQELHLRNYLDGYVSAPLDVQIITCAAGSGLPTQSIVELGNPVDLILVESLSRIARRSDLLLRFLEWARRNGVRVVAVGDKFDSKS